MDDDVLVARTLDGDRRAFRQLVDRYSNAIYGLAISYVGDFDLAEDLAQEAFIRSYYRLPDLQDGQRFGSWLRTIAANLCRMELRRRRGTPVEPSEVDPDDLPSFALAPDEAREQEETHRQVIAALQTLREGERETITLYYLEEERVETVGQLLNLSPAAVKVRLHRARKKLRKEMIEMTEETMMNRKLTTEFAEGVALRTFDDLLQLTDDELRSLARPNSKEPMSLAYALSGDEPETLAIRNRLLEALPELQREGLKINIAHFESQLSPLGDYRRKVLATARKMQRDGSIRPAPRGRDVEGDVAIEKFTDLTRLTDREIQHVLREVDSKDMAVALIPEVKRLDEVKRRLFANVSERVEALIRLEIAHRKATKAEISEAQDRMVSTTQHLQVDGVIRPDRSPSTRAKIDIRLYSDLENLTNRETQHVLRGTELETLVIAFRGRGKGTKAVENQFMRNVSERVASMIKTRLRSESSSRSEVTAAQAEIVATAKRLQILGDIRSSSRRPTHQQFERAVTTAASSQIEERRHGSGWTPHSFTHLVGLLAITMRDEGVSAVEEHFAGIQDPVFELGMRLLGEGADRDTLVQSLEEAARRAMKYKEKEYDRMILGMAEIADGEEPRTIGERLAKV